MFVWASWLEKREKRTGRQRHREGPEISEAAGETQGMRHHPARGRQREAPRLPGHWVTDPLGLGRRRYGAGGVGRRGAGRPAEQVSPECLVSGAAGTLTPLAACTTPRAAWRPEYSGLPPSVYTRFRSIP